MASFRLTNFAERDMEDIGRYTEKQWDRKQRNHYLTELDASFQSLANTQSIGQDCSYIRAGYRKYQVKRHVIFYHIISEGMRLCAFYMNGWTLEDTYLTMIARIASASTLSHHCNNRIRVAVQCYPNSKSDRNCHTYIASF
jgi:toxin ParE1/3/4